MMEPVIEHILAQPESEGKASTPSRSLEAQFTQTGLLWAQWA